MSVAYCQHHDIPMNQSPEPLLSQADRSHEPSAAVEKPFALFDEGLSIEQIAERLQLAISTTHQYLEAYIRQRSITVTTPWMSEREVEQVQMVAQCAGTVRLKLIFEALPGHIGYNENCVASAWLTNRGLLYGDCHAIL